ncbi:MAG: MBL fold metallo-hydrolase [Deltaproteobacteria bacterium]|jgi:glyoxylase-like metal-dependent hydrolase (beta-lactamase superfamily II)|nr:MBL fold metallo-hydrolase [Deltaproteobacteria bacterium]MBW2386705.1 MBL fold metallo-hydrolase [Deltaproteobacteria bacterium]MBW2698403.1 MBL fold metallo-hydrolase [Deltaproteobacteria bacterium]
MGNDSDLYFRQFSVGEMANLAYVIGSLKTREAFVVDPAWNVDTILDQAEADGMKVVGSLVTHFHQDHIGGSLFGHDIEGLAKFMERNAAPVHVNKLEADGVAKVAGIARSEIVAHEGGDVIEIGGIQIRLLHTPGHTPGSQCFLVEEGGQAGSLVSGDTLFLGSCGRVDLPGSDPEQMYESICGTLKRLPDETLLFPGHLYSPEGHSTMGEQKESNPFLRVTSLEMFLQFMGVG